MLQKILTLTLVCASFGRISSAPSGHVVVDLAQEKTNFRGKIHVNGVSHHLNLERPATVLVHGIQKVSQTCSPGFNASASTGYLFPATSVFAPSYRLTETIMTPEGTVMVRDISTHNDVVELEKNLYVDDDANAVFVMENIEGEIHLHGMVQNTHISHDGNRHIAELHNHPSWSFASDDGDTAIVMTPDGSIDSRDVAVANPEVFITVDSSLYHILHNRKYGSTVLTIDEYLAIMIRSVNNRYKTMDDPLIKFKVVGSNILKSEDAQPFIEASRVGEKVDATKALRAFGRFMFKNSAKFPPHDVAPILTAEPFISANGFSSMAGACKVVGQDSKRVSIIQDREGAWYNGLWTLTHELGHSLGAAHDGTVHQAIPPEYPFTDASACPFNGTGIGYIMTYSFDPATSYTFSNCSRRAMKSYINSKEGACLRSDQASKFWEDAPKEAGEYLTFDEQLAMRRPGSKALGKTEDMCSTLVCKTGIYHNYYRYGLDGTKCGSKGEVCHEGKCVVRA